VQIVERGEQGTLSPPKDVRRGGRAKIAVADWNGDGKPDLLVGDFAPQKPDLPEPTAEEKAQHAQIRKEMEPLSKRYGELMSRLSGPQRVQTKEERDKFVKEINEVREQLSKLQSKLPRESETHGWVWLFLRK
jgi:hypothetical protein